MEREERHPTHKKADQTRAGRHKRSAKDPKKKRKG
jgi:hypothetical protein